MDKCSDQQSGQAIMEFVLSLMVTLSFFFFFLKLSLMFAVGNYFHYATFMGARTYLSSDENEEVQKENAEKVMKKMVGKRWMAIAKRTAGSNSSVPGVGIGPGNFYLESEGTTANPYAWNQGVSLAFTTVLKLMPWSRSDKNIQMKLTSESWLGREEATNDCKNARIELQKRIRNTVKSARLEWDNGDEGC